MRSFLVPRAPAWATKWTRFLDALVQAKSSDLESGNWHPPFLPPDQVTDLQAMGRERWGDHYHFIGYELQLLGDSLVASREVDAMGHLRFAVLPQIPADFLNYSGSTDHALTQHRLGEQLADPFAEPRFFHPSTRWYNISSRIGAKKYFRKNVAQVLDLFGQLVASRFQQGKRVLLVVKKLFLALFREGIERRLQDMGFVDAQVVAATDQVPDSLIQQPHCIPIINFGVIGTNRFATFDCCYCLSGFYVEEQTLHKSVQDLYRQDIRLALEIGIRGQPLHRYARVKDHPHRFSEVNRLAQAALDHLEMGCVVQAVGRVRPYTQPREIITFQCAAHPEGAYDREFHTLGEARNFFGIPTGRNRKVQLNRDRVQAGKAQGLTQKQTAVTTGLSLSTVKRHWQASGGVTNL